MILWDKIVQRCPVWVRNFSQLLINCDCAGCAVATDMYILHVNSYRSIGVFASSRWRFRYLQEGLWIFQEPPLDAVRMLCPQGLAGVYKSTSKITNVVKTNKVCQ